MRFAFSLPCLLAIFLPVCLSANLRAPIIHDQHFSSALSGLHEGITVRSAHLRFDLETDPSTPPQNSTCRIKAKYRIHSDNTHKVTLEFLTPTDGAVSWQSGEQEGVARLEKVPLEQVEEEEEIPSAAKLYRAAFDLTLAAGEQLLIIHYDHVPGYRELDYGYFKSSRFVHQIRYAVWPIKEWQLAEDFQLTMDATLQNPATGWWARRKGKEDTLSLTDEKNAVLSPESIQFTEGTLHVTWRWDASGLPHSLHLHAGNADLMERAHGLQYPYP